MKTLLKEQELSLEQMTQEIQNVIDNKNIKLLSKYTRRYFSCTNYFETHNKKNVVFTLDTFNMPLNNRAVTKRAVDVIDYLTKAVYVDIFRPYFQLVQNVNNRLICIGEKLKIVYVINNTLNENIKTYTYDKRLLDGVNLSTQRTDLIKCYKTLIKRFGFVNSSKEYSLNELINRLKFAFDLQKVMSFDYGHFSVVEVMGQYYNTDLFYKALKFYNDMNLGVDDITIEIGSNDVCCLVHNGNKIYIRAEKQRETESVKDLPLVFINKI